MLMRTLCFQVLTLTGDIMSLDEMRKVADDTLSHFGTVDILVRNCRKRKLRQRINLINPSAARISVSSVFHCLVI